MIRDLFAKAADAQALATLRDDLAWSRLICVRQAHEIELLELRCAELERLAHPSNQGDAT